MNCFHNFKGHKEGRQRESTTHAARKAFVKKVCQSLQYSNNHQQNWEAYNNKGSFFNHAAYHLGASLQVSLLQEGGWQSSLMMNSVILCWQKERALESLAPAITCSSLEVTHITIMSNTLARTGHRLTYHKEKNNPTIYHKSTEPEIFDW